VLAGDPSLAMSDFAVAIGVRPAPAKRRFISHRTRKMRSTRLLGSGIPSRCQARGGCNFGSLCLPTQRWRVGV